MDDIASEMGRAVEYTSELTDVAFQLMKHRPSVVKDLMEVWMELHNKQGMFLFSFVNRHILPHRARRIFFLEKPLEWILYTHVNSSNLGLKDCSAMMSSILDLKDDTKAVRIALAYLPSVTDYLRANNPPTPDMMEVMIRLVNIPSTRELMSDAETVRLLAQWPMESKSIAQFCTALVPVCIDPMIFFPAVTSLYTALTAFTSREAHASICSFYEALAKKPVWEEALCNSTLAVIKNKWNVPEIALVAAALLDHPTSVRLLVHLMWEGVLESTRAHAMKEVSNASQSTRLRNAWVCIVRCIDDRTVPAGACTARTTYNCPITCVGCAVPVVASDGHTYERSALMEHISRSGMISPMTRQPLSFHLCPNRALPMVDDDVDRDEEIREIPHPAYESLDESRTENEHNLDQTQ